jgi:hypothetical protein
MSRLGLLCLFSFALLGVAIAQSPTYTTYTASSTTSADSSKVYAKSVTIPGPPQIFTMPSPHKFRAVAKLTSPNGRVATTDSGYIATNSTVTATSSLSWSGDYGQYVESDTHYIQCPVGTYTGQSTTTVVSFVHLAILPYYNKTTFPPAPGAKCRYEIFSPSKFPGCAPNCQLGIIDFDGPCYDNTQHPLVCAERRVSHLQVASYVTCLLELTLYYAADVCGCGNQ